MSIYEEYLMQYRDLENSEIADIIMKEEAENIDAKRKSIMRRLQEARKKNRIDLIGTGNRGDSYHIDGDQYVFNFDGYVFDIPKNEVAALFRWYPDPWGNTQQELLTKMRNYFGRDLSPDFLSRVLKCLNLTKKSNPLAPHIIDEWNEEEIADYYLQIKSEKIEFNCEIDESEQWQKLYKREVQKNIDMRNLVNSVAKRITNDDLPVFYNPAPRNEREESASMNLVLSDWHVGKHIDLPRNKFNKEVFRERTMRLVEEIRSNLSCNTRQIDEANIIILGDMLDGPMGTMHADQMLGQDLHHVDQVVWGARGLSVVIDAFYEMCGTEHVNIHSVGGNHGRVTASRDDDPTRFADQVMYAMANEMCRSRNINWVRHEDVFGSFITKNTQVFLSHGERTTKNMKDFVLINRDESVQDYVFCSGHYHYVAMEEVASHLMRIQGGCMCGVDGYAARNGVGSRAAQLMFEVRASGPRPIIYLPVQ